MDANLLFLHRVRQLALLVSSNEEIDLVDVAGRLRQLLFDKRSLVDVVNPGIELEFELETVVFGPGGPKEATLKLNRHDFCRHVVIRAHGHPFTVKDIVKYNANQKGGSHWDPTGKAEFEKLRFWETLVINGVAAPTRYLTDIGRSVVKALDPVVRAVEARAS